MSAGGSQPDLLRDLGIADALPQIAAYIARQRWSGAADRGPGDARIDDAVLLRDADPALFFCVVRITHEDAGSMRYALPLGVRGPQDVIAERAPDYIIGHIGQGERSGLLYDALGDPLYVQWCLRAIRAGSTVRGSSGGALAAHALAGEELPDDERGVRLLAVEQSNTSLVVDERFFFKHLRRIEEGPSQELEMAAALRSAHFEHAVPVLGTMHYASSDASPGSPVVLLQPFLHNATEGWNIALTSLRDLYADAEESEATSVREVHTAVNDQGGAFVADSARLGTVVAGLHLALAHDGLGPGFEPQPVDAATLSRWADSMTADVDALLRNPAPVLDSLRDVRGSLVSRFDELRELQPGGLRIRIHGDLHLGQMLRVSSGWMVLDFEGEPNRTPSERREPSTPLRDVAGMLRSFDYAAAVALAERARPDSEDWERMMAYGDAWAQANRDAFWSAYLETIGDSALLPSPGAAMVTRRAFEVHKAAYEVGYELGHRPSWVRIPLRFLLRGMT